jgi:phosphoribosylamine---glycine ligase
MARILIVSYSMYGSWFSLQLEAEGHTVDIWLMDHYNDYSHVLSGLIKTPFKEKPDFKKYDLVLFDLTGRPKTAEEIMNLGIPVIGDGDLNSELEDNRLFGIEVMEQCDIGVPFYEQFDDISTAKRFIKKTNKTFVFKPSGGQDQDTASTYVSKSPEDMLKYLDKLGAISKGAEFILQEVVQGTEISTEGWFNGEDFFLINGTLEEKKFMDKNRGPNTGCSGNLVWLYDQVNLPYIFREGLQKLKGFLQEYKYRGMIDLNTIVSDSKLYGLEWTPRFGYDASATLYSCFNDGLGDFLGEVASGGIPRIGIDNNFAAGIRLSIPPYPSEIKNKHPAEVPIEGIDEDDCIKSCFLYDAMLDDSDNLVSAGVNGLICVPISSAGSIQAAFGKLSEKIKKIHIPDMQYRNDIEESTTKRYRILDSQGWLR